MEVFKISVLTFEEIKNLVCLQLSNTGASAQEQYKATNSRTLLVAIQGQLGSHQASRQL